MKVFEPNVIHGTNEFGHAQTYIRDVFELIPSCTSCYATVMLNRGQGTLCDSCAHDILIKMSHDYDMGEL